MPEANSDTPGSSSSRPVRRHKPHRYAPALLVVLGAVANATAVVDLFMQNIGAVGPVAGALTIVVGLYLLLSGWGRRVGWRTLLAVAIIVAGSVSLSLILQKNGYIDTSNRGGGGSSKKEDTNVITDKGTYYTLKANEGLDVDDGKESILVQQDSAKAPSDLYFSDWAYLDGTTGSFYAYQPLKDPSGDATKDQADACRNLMDISDMGKDVITASSLVPGKVYCAVTTKDAVMLVSVEEIVDKGIGSDESTVSFYVKLLK